MERLGGRRATLAGAAVSLALWVLFSAGLALYFSMRSDSGDNPYGPLLAVVALLLWSMLTSLALHLGMSTVCELSGARHPDGGDCRLRVAGCPRGTAGSRCAAIPLAELRDPSEP